MDVNFALRAKMPPERSFKRKTKEWKDELVIGRDC